MKLSWETAFKGYVKKIAERHSRARSFFHRADPEYLYKFYVPIGVRTKARRLPRVDCKPLFSVTNHVVIQGSGGCGKSTLTRHLLLDILRVRERIPVLVELRSLNQEWRPIVELISGGLADSGLALGPHAVTQGIKSGRFALLFDGFDELDESLRAKAAKEIRKCAVIGRDTWILVTSRPDEMFSGWSEFTIYQALPLSLDQAIDLVSKTPIEDDLRLKFTEDLRARLFKKHKSFLSNPLLLSIMLLTYQDAADIPKKLSVFYSQAYEALFQRHDAWKGAYKRPRKCDLDVHDFARLFAAFSLIAYDRRLFSFSSVDATSFIKKACSLTGISVPTEYYLADCTQAVCLLVQDGLQIAYSHRSFQEYFVARFIADAPPTIKSKLLDRCGKNLGQDNVIGLLHEIQPEFVETSFILPQLEKYFTAIKVSSGKISRSAHLRFLKSQFSSIRVDKSTGIGAVYKAQMHESIMPLLRLAACDCSHLSNRKFSFIKDSEEEVAFRDRVCGESEFVDLPLENLNIRSPAVDLLFRSGGHLSAEILGIAWEVLVSIKAKQSLSEKPLDEVLGV